MWHDIAKRWAPPALIAMYHALHGEQIRFQGIYTTWENAARHALGYDADAIVWRVREATHKVLAGEAAAERDSVLFDRATYPYPVISVLLRAACENDHGLTVLDFGGAFGSSYYQCRDFLSAIRPLRWHIVEQPAFVECGRSQFETDVVRFFDTIDSCVDFARPDVVLASGVLQYVPNPEGVLGALSRSGAKYIVVDRTPIAVSGKQTITVQLVPAAISQSSYPTWLFDEKRLKEPLLSDYEEIADFDALDGLLGSGLLRAHFKGFIFQRRQRDKDRST